ncbi:MAG: hypothetical protein H0V29_07335 [Thermoleophilaceae bacterium]|nr:hypothetical protein [Thermoleophilaceae bacterium]
MNRLLRPLTLLLAVALCASATAAFDPAYEQRNFSKTGERFRHLTGTPDYQQELRTKGTASEAEIPPIIAGDPERASMLSNLCVHHMDGCAGDVRFYDWPNAAQGRVRNGPVTWISRTGAIISGHVWMNSGGEARKPGVVITNGSVQAPEQLYWPLAAALAEAGYVVLTWDPQTQGRSSGPQGEYQAQSPTLFIEGTQDALDFFLSTASAPYQPRPENQRLQGPPTGATGNFATKQDAKVAAKQASASNPFADRLDPSRIGIAGHSLGAYGVSVVGNVDPRVDALVAYDNLTAGGGEMFGQTVAPIPSTKPALGMANDYGLTPQPNTSEPDPQSRNDASRKASAAGNDTAQVNIRGGTHYEYAVIPNPGFGATLRGLDKAGWYTLGWMHKYVKGDTLLGDRMLLSDRWQRDKAEGDIDPDKDGNTYSSYLRSRIDIKRADGSKATCEDLRKGCGILKDDGLPGFGLKEFAFGQEGPKPGSAARFNGALRGGSCVTSAKVPKRVRRGKRFRVKLKLAQDTRVLASVRKVKKPRAKTRASASKRSLKAGTRVLKLKAPKRAGRYRLSLTGRCTGGKQTRRITLKVR